MPNLKKAPSNICSLLTLFASLAFTTGCSTGYREMVKETFHPHSTLDWCIMPIAIPCLAFMLPFDPLLAMAEDADEQEQREEERRERMPISDARMKEAAEENEREREVVGAESNNETSNYNTKASRLTGAQSYQPASQSNLDQRSGHSPAEVDPAGWLTWADCVPKSTISCTPFHARERRLSDDTLEIQFKNLIRNSGYTLKWYHDPFMREAEARTIYVPANSTVSTPYHTPNAVNWSWQAAGSTVWIIECSEN
jgi:hypothetical protein